ncbi:UNVERIFIED_CONTAM: hypothetical protein Scaly_1785300 [Sesamum calycinum]|uniref:Retrotransposon gag domain-containing protein n=1 Tax=Sesamum calycinum TaxID=2727403 RepID=A0AAW2NY09_9LAMI
MGQGRDRTRTPPQTRSGQVLATPNPRNGVPDPPHAGQSIGESVVDFVGDCGVFMHHQEFRCKRDDFILERCQLSITWLDGISVDTHCALCEAEVESLRHILLECSFALLACALDSAANDDERWHEAFARVGRWIVGLCWCHDKGLVNDTWPGVGSQCRQMTGEVRCAHGQTCAHCGDARQAVRIDTQGCERFLAGWYTVGTECVCVRLPLREQTPMTIGIKATRFSNLWFRLETGFVGLQGIRVGQICEGSDDVVDIKLEALKTDLRLVKKVVASGGTEVPNMEKVSITSMYLIGDTKLWWRSRLSNDASANWEHIEMWEVLEKEFKDQFLPFNTSWVARESLRNLGHIGMIREFVKEFSSLILDRKNDSGESNVKFGKKFKKKEKAKEVVMETFEPCAVEKPMGGCFICGNLEHRARNCLKRNRLNAIVVEQKTMKALVDTGATTNFISDQVVQELGLDVKPYDSQVKAVNSKIVPVSGIANIELSVGRNKLTFVRVEYDGGTTTTKKFEMAEAKPSNACSSKEGAQSPRLADFSCIGKMPKEMDKRWTKACALDSAANDDGRRHEAYARVVSADDGRSQAHAWASRRPCAGTLGRQAVCADGLNGCAHARQGGRLSVAAKAWWLAALSKAWSMCGACDEVVKS